MRQVNETPERYINTKSRVRLGSNEETNLEFLHGRVARNAISILLKLPICRARKIASVG